jgi:hypothetical protein
MRETRQSGSEGGGKANPLSLPYRGQCQDAPRQLPATAISVRPGVIPGFTRPPAAPILTG